jgi:catechol 2,3-dioxygenase
MDYGIAAPAYRLPVETHVGRVHLQVSNLARSIDFYESVLGFSVLERAASSATLGAGGVAFIELTGGARTPRTVRRLGLYHFAILLPDRAALGRCLTHLLSAGIQPGAADHLVSEALYLQDPDDLGIEIYRDRPRSEWRANGAELVMSTEPLDFHGLTSAASSESWKGMPAGTIIGHVHLHVGDLEQALQFYHAALGLDLVVWSYPGARFLSAGGYHHHLGLNTWAGPRATASAPDEPRLIDWELSLPTAVSVADAARSLAEAGYLVTPEEVGGSVALDPWGTAVRLTVCS